MNETIITKHLYHHLLWKKWQKIVTHQFTTKFGIADVWSINEKKISSEFEIKTDKYDLLSELVPIKEILSGKTHGDWSKWAKHFKYLTWVHHDSIPVPGRTYHPKWGFADKSLWDKSIPNNFYFVVTKDLVPIAKEYLEWTPYWLISVEELKYPNHTRYVISSEKKVKALHKEPCWDWMIFDLAHRMSWVCQKLVSQ